MPVLIAPADTPIGVALARALRAEDAEVRGYVTGAGDVAALRSVGVHVAAGDLDDEGRIEAALTNVHTAIALHADPLAADATALDLHLRVFLQAAASAAVSRLVVRSVPGPSKHADELRRVCAGVEAALVGLELPTVAVRTSLVDTPTVRDALASLAAPDRDLAVAPLAASDVVDAVVALDRARGTDPTGHATFRLQGPATTLGGYLDHLGDSMVGRVYTPADAVPLFAPSLQRAWVEPDDGPTADLLAFAGLTPTPLPPTSSFGGGQ